MSSRKYSKIFAALPVKNESEFLPSTLDCIRKQTFKNFKLYICVNQPEAFWGDNEKVNICSDNQQTILFLEKIKDIPITLIDRSSKGLGWETKKMGVGWARKTIMDKICEKADSNDIIISIDADTSFSENYFQSVLDNFNHHPKATGMAVPYYHRLISDEAVHRAILRYEIYMRNYSLNLFRIGSPYSFTALGSAMACPVWAYQGVGGLTPKLSGEDFYFLQKLRKYGELIFWNKEKVYPSPRRSDRVVFGTGPAVIKGISGDWSSYPIYHYSIFDHIKKMYDLFPALFIKDIETPLTNFLQEQFNTQNLWQPLRENFTDIPHFVKACHDKIDGLRILQYLKTTQKNLDKTDEECLADFILKFYQNIESIDLTKLSFNDSSIEELNAVRNFLVKKEEEYQKSLLTI